MDLPDKSVPPQKEKVVKAVIPKGAGKAASRPVSRRFLDYIFAESPKNLIGTVMANVFVPRMKAAGEEALNNFIHGMMWGGGQPPTSMITRGTVLRGGGVVINPTDYNALSNPMVQAAAASNNSMGPYQDLILPNEQYAELVLANLIDLLNQYRVVTVADLYESAQLTPEPHYSNLGWYGLDGARITKERDGFRLMLPRPVRV